MRRELAGLILFIFGSAAQAASQPLDLIPTASRYPVLDIGHVDLVVPEKLDLMLLREQDVTRDRLGLPPRFAVPERVSITPAQHGTWEDLGKGQMLWRLRIIGREGTTSLNLGFTRFKMSKRSRLLLYSTDGLQITRPFTVADNEEHGQLWTPVVITNDLIVELTVPKKEMKVVQLRLGWINQGYRGFGTIAGDDYNKSGNCHLDVECLDASDPWRKEMRSVGVISTGGSTFCTGSLVNNTAGDRKMYFMTAYHCGITSSNAASLVVYWNYQNSFCRAPGSAASGQAGDGQLNQFHTGSFFRAANATSDFTLVELDDPPVTTYNHYWAGWDRSTGSHTCTTSAPCSSIHHPATDEKRITYVTTDLVSTSANNPTSPGDGTHLWARWAVDPPGPYTVPGVTEPGSSGSPLYNAAGRFVGQLHGGPSYCGATGNDLSDYYGRFSVSWAGGGTTSTRLSNWLDPGNTGATAINGLGASAATSPATPYFFENYFGWGDLGQCGYNSGDFLYGSQGFEAGTWTTPVRMDTDNRPGGCIQQFGLYDPSGRLSGLLLKVEFQGTENQCWERGTHTVPISSVPSSNWSTWSSEYRIDTDDKGGYCTQTFSIEGRSDVALDVSFEAESNNGQCGNVGTFPVVSGRPATFIIDTDGRSGGCRQKFRLRLNTDADNDGFGDQIDSCPYVYGTGQSGCGSSSSCGNGLCESGENVWNCPSDCGGGGFCGDSVCSSGEDSFTCPGDCGFCGDGDCRADEDPFNCPDDCGYCGDSVCNPGEDFFCPGDCCVPGQCQ